MGNRGKRGRKDFSSGAAWIELPEDIDWDRWERLFGSTISSETRNAIDARVTLYHANTGFAEHAPAKRWARGEFKRKAKRLLARIEAGETIGTRADQELISLIVKVTPEDPYIDHSDIDHPRIEKAIGRLGGGNYLVPDIREVDAFREAVRQIRGLLEGDGIEVRLSTRWDDDCQNATPFEFFICDYLRQDGSGEYELRAIYRAFENKQ